LRLKHVVATLLVVSTLLIATATSLLITSYDPSSKVIIINPAGKSVSALAQINEPIIITSNLDFALFGATGVGTRSEPYKFENLQVIENGSCIQIQDTTAYFVISNCSLESSNDDPVILFQNVENGRVEECETKGGSSGVELYQSVDCTVEDNILYDCYNGVSLLSSANNTVLGNRIHGNHKGIFFDQTNHCLIISNSIYSNFRYGIQIPFNSHNNTIYGNRIGWNDISGIALENAFDSGEDNAFDDGVSLGNFWSDFNESEIYRIPGNAASIDQFAQLLEDRVAPGVIPLDDVAIDVEAVGSILIWSVYDQFPEYYIISENDMQVVMDLWESDVISYELDHLDIGTYTILLTLYDAPGNVASDTVIVEVISRILGGIGTELVMIASGITVASFVIVVYLIKRLS